MITLNDQQTAAVRNAYSAISRLKLKNPDSQINPQVVAEDPLAHYDLEVLRDPITQHWQTYLFAVYHEALNYSPIPHETTQTRRVAAQQLGALMRRIPTTGDLKAKFPFLVLDAPLRQILDEDLANLLASTH